MHFYVNNDMSGSRNSDFGIFEKGSSSYGKNWGRNEEKPRLIWIQYIFVGWISGMHDTSVILSFIFLPYIDMFA